MARKPDGPLRKGWTTGACATAATRAAWQALLSGDFPDPVTITLPRGETPSFKLIKAEKGDGWARASVIKDAGDDADVTHGAEIISTVRIGKPGAEGFTEPQRRVRKIGIDAILVCQRFMEI